MAVVVGVAAAAALAMGVEEEAAGRQQLWQLPQLLVEAGRGGARGGGGSVEETAREIEGKVSIFGLLLFSLMLNSNFNYHH